jgi:hypothetical protein
MYHLPQVFKHYTLEFPFKLKDEEYVFNFTNVNGQAFNYYLDESKLNGHALMSYHPSLTVTKAGEIVYDSHASASIFVLIFNFSLISILIILKELEMLMAENLNYLKVINLA